MSKDNVLEPGRPRLGWLVDGDPDTPRTAVMLQDTGSQIDLTMLTDEVMAVATDAPYARWWSGGITFVDDTDRTKYRDRPPRVMQVEDVRGSVVLVGCQAGASKHNLRYVEGHIVANYAVLGGSHLDYETVNGIRTEVPALAAWSRVRSIDYQPTLDEEGKVESLQLTLRRHEEIALAPDLNLKLRIDWKVDSQDDGAAIHHGVVLETLVEEPIAWDEHFRVHRLMLGLATLSAWKRFGFSSVWSRRDDDGRGNANGEMQPYWNAVVTHDLPPHEGLAKSLSFLYPFSEVGPEVVQRWLRLHSDYADAIDPLLNILWSEHQWGHAAVVQSGIALENLGYQIAVRKNGGQGLNRRRQLNFKPALRLILDDMAVKPFDGLEQWIEDAHAVYMGAKHPDRPTVDVLTQVNTLRKNLLIIRFWLGLQLGICEGSLLAALPRDPLYGERVLVR